MAKRSFNRCSTELPFSIKKDTLVVPEAMEKLIPANIVEGKSSPAFSEPIHMDWYTEKEKDDVAQETCATDMAFVVLRQDKNIRPSWTTFNQSLSKDSHAITTVGYMPIIQAPAHELDTLNTVVQRCMYISLGQQYTVLTVDQALYYKLMEFKWTIPEYKEKLIPRLGGLHISMNFLKVIRQHTRECELSEARVESGILGPNSTEHALAGKAYNKTMRSHKFSTFQALWRILFPALKSFLQDHDVRFMGTITALMSSYQH